MLLSINEENQVIITEKFLLISDFRKYYDRYYDKKDPDLVVAYFSMLYYMYHFDSKFLWEYENDESKRLAEVKKYIYRGKDVKITPDVRRIMELYKSFYNKEMVSSYITMRKSLAKLRLFADNAVLVMPPDADPDNPPILIESKELMAINKEIPELWKRLDKFEKDLLNYTKSSVDIYGSKSLNVYE